MHAILVGPEYEENLSLRYLAAVLRRAGHTAVLSRFDCPQDTDGVVAQVLRQAPDLVGLSLVFQVRAGEFCALASALRRAGYRGHITAGGHFATFGCEYLLRDAPAIDTVVRQEGEQTLVELAGALSAGGSLECIPGLAFRGSDGKIVLTPARRHTDDLDALPFPARDGQREVHLGVPTAYLVGTRGCYAACDYCCISAWHAAGLGKRYRLRSPGNIADEMAELYHLHGVRFFVFHDDNFFLPTPAGNLARFAALRDGLRERGVLTRVSPIGLMLKLRPNDCAPPSLEVLREMGLARVFIGIENASARQMRSLGRSTTVEQAHAALDLLGRLGIYATYNVLLFDAYTTLDDVEANLRFLRAHPDVPFNWCRTEPYAGTAIERRYAAEGRLRRWGPHADYTMDDPRAALLCEALQPAFRYRNFDYFGLANLNIGLGYHLQMLRHFYADSCDEGLETRARRLIHEVNEDAVALLERGLAFARAADPEDREASAEFAARLAADSNAAHHRLGARLEEVMRDIEVAARLRTAEVPPVSAPAGVSRRRAMALLATGAAATMAGCAKPPKGGPARPALVTTGAPRGVVELVPGTEDTVKPGGVFFLSARLDGADVKVVGEPAVTCTGGTVARKGVTAGGRQVDVDWTPAGGFRMYDPNVEADIAWTVRQKTGETTIKARAFAHAREDGTYSFGYETPRPAMPEMAPMPLSGRGGK